MSPAGDDPGIFTTCMEISGTIRTIDKAVQIGIYGPKSEVFGLSFYKSLRGQLFNIYRSNLGVLRSQAQTLVFYDSLRHDDMVWGIQYFLTNGGFRIFVYRPTHGLPQYFQRQAEIHLLKEKQRIRGLLETGMIRDDVFALYYQPIVQIDQQGNMRSIKGAEAFMRVKDRGELHSPKKYLDIAEEDPALMRKLGYKILELACSDLKWFKAKYPLFTVSLNVSEQQFARFDDAISFERIFASIKEQYEIERHDIALEVPEVTADSNAESAAMLKRLFDEGTPIILDNFTIGALMRDTVVEIDKYKISGQMLRDCCYGAEREKFVARDFLQRVFSAARKFNKSVVVKEVESLDQIPVLREQGFDPEFDLLQGYAFCPPIDLPSFEMIYKENVTRLYRSQLLELFKNAEIRVLSQNLEILIEICAYFTRKRLSTNIQVGQSFSDLWSTSDRKLVVVLDYNFTSQVVSPDQFKDASQAEENWQAMLRDGSLFEIPGLPMALINNFQDLERIAEKFALVEEYDGHNLYQILITINREKTEKIPFIIISANDTQLKFLEENVVILNNLNSLDDFEDSFVESIAGHPKTIGKFSRF